jgi:hypothetical protein
MLLRSDSYWLAPVALLSLLFCSAYAIASKTVPYPRTFGIWLVYALAGVAWVWRYSHLCGRLRGLACRIVISGIVILTLLESIAHPVSLAEKVNFGVLGLRVNELIRRTKATPNNTLVLLPFIFSEQMRFYLPDDDRFLSPATDNGSKLTVYIPCSKLENQNAFRCQYYDRAKAELVGFPLPATWNQFKVFDQAGYSLFAVPMSLSRNSANAATDPATAHIVVWTSKDPYFNLAKYVTDNVQKNTAPWNVHLLTSRTTTSSSVTFFTSGQEELRSVETILENLHERTAGETFFLTPGF